MVPKHSGVLCPIPKFKQFNCYIHIPTFKMPTIKQVWELILQDDYAFFINLEEASLHFPISKCHHFLHFLAK